MPYPAHELEHFKQEYGAKEGVRRFFANKNAHPQQFAKALHTAQSEGKGHVAEHSATKPHSHIIARVKHRRHT